MLKSNFRNIIHKKYVIPEIQKHNQMVLENSILSPLRITTSYRYSDQVFNSYENIIFMSLLQFKYSLELTSSKRYTTDPLRSTFIIIYQIEFNK